MIRLIVHLSYTHTPWFPATRPSTNQPWIAAFYPSIRQPASSPVCCEFFTQKPADDSFPESGLFMSFLAEIQSSCLCVVDPTYNYPVRQKLRKLTAWFCGIAVVDRKVMIWRRSRPSVWRSSVKLVLSPVSSASVLYPTGTVPALPFNFKVLDKSLNCFENGKKTLRSLGLAGTNCTSG